MEANRPLRHKRAALPVALLVLVVFGLSSTACELRFRLGQQAEPIEVPEGRQVVQLEIIEGAGGSVLVLVPVMIDGKGPFRFALDTGASQTLLDSGLVAQLGLEVTGEVGPVTGIVGATTADEVVIESWSIGEVQLPAARAVGLEMTAGGAGAVEFRGLLGADILRRFKVITLDFDKGLLILGEYLLASGYSR